MWTSTESTKKELECAVCMEPCAKLSITCCNGHVVCENHYLHRTKAIYEEGRSAFNNEQKVQRCFLCRTDIPDEKFSDQHNKTMKAVIVDGRLKIAEKITGIALSTEQRNNLYKELLKEIEELGI